MPVSISLVADVDRVLSVRVDDAKITAYIGARLNDARNHFIRNMSGGGPSLPGDFPKTDTGRLAASVDFDVGFREGSLFTDVEYARFLVTGTRHMAERKMLADALEEIMDARPATDELADIFVIE
jgi:hypothetical protein